MTSRNQNYISEELIHFAGSGLNKEEQYNTLCKILRCKAITHPPHYPDGSSVTTIRLSRKISENEMYNPDMICFCDIPVDNLSIHIKKYSPFGLSFYKNFIVQNGGCPVFYIPLKGKVATNIQKADYFDNMLKEYHSLCGYLEDLMKKHDHRPAFGLPQNFKRFYELQRFLAHQLFSYIKFFEHTLHEEHPDNYYFEREWRIIGQLKFKPEDIKTIFMPYEYTNRFKKDFPEYKGAIFQL